MDAWTHSGYRRALAAIGVAGAAVVGVAACEPTTGGLSSAAVAVTTDKTATSTLERLRFDVRWLSCTATIDERAGKTGSASPAARSRATVDCQGETDDGKEITLKGKVTEERSGKCVRGDLTARVSGKIVFQATMLGNCAAAATNTPPPTSPDDPGSDVTATVTVTVTESADQAK